MDNNEEKIEEQKTEEIEEQKTEEIEEQEDDEQEDKEVFTYTIDSNKNSSSENGSVFYIIIGLIILISIIVVLIVLNNKKQGKVKDYSEIESRLVEAAKNYYEKKPEELPKNESESTSVDAQKLIQSSVLVPFSEMLKEDIECTGVVKTYKVGEDYSYFPFVNCGNTYKSTKLNDKIIEQNTITEQGLYKIGKEYVFRGEYPNNYVKFNNSTWRIIKINEDGSIKLIINDKKIEKTVWDDRYNSNTSGYTGKNDFRVSRILEELNEIYKDTKYISKDNKALLVKGNWCIGKMQESGEDISNINLCSDTYNDLYVGLITIKEAVEPSLDSECKNIYDNMCTNYNYLEEIELGWTLNATSDYSQEVFVAIGATISPKNASSVNILRPVININSDILYKSGNGTEKDPYIIGK